MATITAVRSANGTLGANTVDTVTLSARTNSVSGEPPRVVIENNTLVNDSGAASIYVTNVASATPTVRGSDTYAILPGQHRTVPFNGTVKLVSSGTPKYSVYVRNATEPYSFELEQEHNTLVSTITTINPIGDERLSTLVSDEVATHHFNSWASLMGAETWGEANTRVPSWAVAHTNETWGSL